LQDIDGCSFIPQHAPVCVFWNEGEQEWSTEGCTLVSDPGDDMKNIKLKEYYKKLSMKPVCNNLPLRIIFI
jgi:hypothetical protein